MRVISRRAALLAVLAALLLAAGAPYVVRQSQQAVVVRFGEPVAVINAGARGGEAGLYLRWPLVDQVLRFDRRSLPLQADPSDMATADEGRLSVQPQMRFRISDPLRLYRALGAPAAAAARLRGLLEASVRQTLAAAPLQDIVATRREALAQAALADLRQRASTGRLGIEVSEVNLLDVSPPADAVPATTRRMQDEAVQQAARVRTEGEQHRRERLAAADREVADIHGEAERQALDIRGDGDAQRADILGQAYGKDADFARFFRRLEAYDQALNPDNTTLVLSPDNAFLDVFGHGPQGAAEAR